MSYSLKTTKRFEKEFAKLDHYTKRIIKSWINKNLVSVDNPRFSGKSLTGNLRGLWRYRIGDYRLICDIKDKELIILAISIGHRRDIYKP